MKIVKKKKEEKEQKDKNKEKNEEKEKIKIKEDIIKINNENNENDEKKDSKNTLIIKEEEEKEKNIALLGKKRKLPALPLTEINDDYEKKDKKVNDINNIINTNNTSNLNNINNIQKNEEKNNEVNYNNININNEYKCKRKKYIKYEEILNNIIQNEQNIFIDCEIFLKNLCKCKSCQELDKKLGFDYLNNENVYKEWESRKTFDDIINDENFIDEAERENPISLENVNGTLNDFFNSKEYKQLTCEQ